MPRTVSYKLPITASVCGKYRPRLIGESTGKVAFSACSVRSVTSTLRCFRRRSLGAVKRTSVRLRGPFGARGYTRHRCSTVVHDLSGGANG